MSSSPSAVIVRRNPGRTAKNPEKFKKFVQSAIKSGPIDDEIERQDMLKIIRPSSSKPQKRASAKRKRAASQKLKSLTPLVESTLDMLEVFVRNVAVHKSQVLTVADRSDTGMSDLYEVLRTQRLLAAVVKNPGDIDKLIEE